MKRTQRDRRTDQPLLRRIGVYLPVLAVLGLSIPMLIYLGVMQSLGWHIPVISSASPGYVSNTGAERNLILYTSSTTERYFKSIGGDYGVILNTWRGGADRNTASL